MKKYNKSIISINKGEIGYINRRKIQLLVNTLLLLLIVLIIYYTGIIRYHNNKNIFTVLAALSAIPAAKVAVSYIVMFPYHSMLKERYKRIPQSENFITIFDLLISSKEKIIPIESITIKSKSVYCLMTSKKVDTEYVEKYIRSFLETENKIHTVKVFCDDEKYMKVISNLPQNEICKEDQNIKKLLLIYSL